VEREPSARVPFPLFATDEEGGIKENKHLQRRSTEGKRDFRFKILRHSKRANRKGRPRR